MKSGKCRSNTNKIVSQAKSECDANENCSGDYVTTNIFERGNEMIEALICLIMAYIAFLVAVAGFVGTVLLTAR